MLRRFLVIAVICLARIASAVEGRIDALEIRGLDRTEAYVVHRELPWKAGDTITSEQWDLGLARLWNSGLFAHIDARVEDVDGVRRAVLDLEERITLNPLFRFAFVGTNGLIRLGASDTNILGRFLEIGAQYERFGAFNGGQAWIRQPRLFSKRLQGLILAERLTRPRTGFAVVRSLLRFETFGEIHDHLALSARADILSDRIVELGEGERPVDSAGVIVSASVRFGRVDIERLRHRSWQLELRPLSGETSDPVHPKFRQITADLLWFVMAGEGWTFATRLQAGLQTEAPLQHRFHIGGIDLVRGFADNTLRTGAFALGNFEARYVAFDSTWIALVPAVFVDAAIARDDAGGASTIASVGGGCRFLVPKLLNMGTRVDIAVPITTGGSPLLSLGVYQFF